MADRPLRLAFGSVAETYDRVRPPYFQPLLDRAEVVLELGFDACVVDLGAGSGRLTRELATRFGRVIAVEPDDGMRDLLDVGSVLAGTAQAIREIARLLRAGGALAVISTHWWETVPPLPESVIEVLREPYARFADQRRPRWDQAFEASRFQPLQCENFEDEITVDAERLLALYSTTSSCAALASDEREALFAAVRPRLAGPYRLPIKHELCWTRLT